MSERGSPWTARWAGGLATDIEGRGHVLRADEPPEVGGEGSGPMPTELLAAALASCFVAAVVWAARKRRIEIEDVEARVTPIRAPGEPRYEAYEVTLRTSCDPDAIRPAFELAQRYCWVSNTLRQPPRIDYRLETER